MVAINYSWSFLFIINCHLLSVALHRPSECHKCFIHKSSLSSLLCHGAGGDISMLQMRKLSLREVVLLAWGSREELAFQSRAVSTPKAYDLNASFLYVWVVKDFLCVSSESNIWGCCVSADPSLPVSAPGEKWKQRSALEHRLGFLCMQ